MAGPSIGTWVKVKNKSGRMTARVLAKKFGGGEYEQGQVITQSEYQSFQKKRAEAIAGDGNASAQSNKRQRRNTEGENVLRKIQSNLRKVDDFADNKVEEISFDNLAKQFSRKELNALSKEVGIALSATRNAENRATAGKDSGGEGASRIKLREMKALTQKLEKMDRLDGLSLAKNLSTRDLLYLSEQIGAANNASTKQQANRRAPRDARTGIELRTLDRKMGRQLARKDGLSVRSLAKNMSPRELSLLSNKLGMALESNKGPAATQAKGTALSSARRKYRSLVKSFEGQLGENTSYNDFKNFTQSEVRALQSQVLLAMGEQRRPRRR